MTLPIIGRLLLNPFKRRTPEASVCAQPRTPAAANEGRPLFVRADPLRHPVNRGKVPAEQPIHNASVSPARGGVSAQIQRRENHKLQPEYGARPASHSSHSKPDAAVPRRFGPKPQVDRHSPVESRAAEHRTPVAKVAPAPVKADQSVARPSTPSPRLVGLRSRDGGLSSSSVRMLEELSQNANRLLLRQLSKNHELQEQLALRATALDKAAGIDVSQAELDALASSPATGNAFRPVTDTVAEVVARMKRLARQEESDPQAPKS